MRILYIDVDALRPDHLGCCGYPRATSPTIDRLAAEGTRFDQVYVSDAPCLPSRSALATGRFGIRNGAVDHGGRAADLASLGRYRTFNTHPDYRSWFQALQDAGHRTAAITTFPQRHGAWWFASGLHEWHNLGTNGMELAEDVNAVAEPWLEAHAREPDWFLHVNYWDAHTPYRTPHEDGSPWDEPVQSWLDEATLERQWHGYGPMSAQDASLAWFGWRSPLPWVPEAFRTIDDHRRWIDGYDAGIRHLDAYVGRLLSILERQGVLDDTVVIATADHGENLGELNVHGDHQTADEATCRVPLIVRAPGRLPAGAVDGALRYQFDVAPTVLAWAGEEIPGAWDARAMLDGRGGLDGGRDHLVLSQMAWSCQRAVRFDDWLVIRTYHDGLKDLPPTLLFDVARDPHETRDRSGDEPGVVARGAELLERWHADAMARALHAEDPMQTVLRQGGPFHVRGELERYARRLRETGRGEHAAALEGRHGRG